MRHGKFYTCNNMVDYCMYGWSHIVEYEYIITLLLPVKCYKHHYYHKNTILPHPILYYLAAKLSYMVSNGNRSDLPSWNATSNKP